jgi:hypothetical protein
MILEVINNPQRYSRKENVWSVDASSGSLKTIPYTFPAATKELTLYPVLDDSIVVIIKIEDDYFCSQELYTDLMDSKNVNPHLWYDDVTTVNTLSGSVVIGNTLPIIELDLQSIRETAEIEGIMIPFAGVKEVEWIYDRKEDEDTNVPVSKKLLQQLNYSLTDSTERPPDEWELWDLNLAANYTIQQMPVLSPTTDKAVVDKGLLTKNLEELQKRITDLRKDFNDIKRIYYTGKVKDDSISTTNYNSIAFGSNAPQTELKGENGTAVVYKSTELVSVDKNSGDKRADALDSTITTKTTELKTELQDTKTSTQEALNTQAENLKRAQAGDAEAQRQLAAELRASNQRTTELAAKIPNPNR